MLCAACSSALAVSGPVLAGSFAATALPTLGEFAPCLASCNARAWMAMPKSDDLAALRTSAVPGGRPSLSLSAWIEGERADGEDGWGEDRFHKSVG